MRDSNDLHGKTAPPAPRHIHADRGGRVARPWAVLIALGAGVLFSACAAGGDQGEDGFLISAGNNDTSAGSDAGTADEIGDQDGSSTGSSTDTTTTDTTESSTGTTTDTTTTDTTESSTDTTTETGDPPPLPCDPKFDLISPNPPSAGQPFTARFSDTIGYVYVGMSVAQIQGVGSPVVGNEMISGNNPFHWAYTITGHGAGIVELTFSSDMGASVHGTCQLYVQ